MFLKDVCIKIGIKMYIFDLSSTKQLDNKNKKKLIFFKGNM
jgi:hypothetical protein